MDTLRTLVRVLFPLVFIGCSLTTHFDDYRFGAAKKDASAGGGKSDAGSAGGSGSGAGAGGKGASGGRGSAGSGGSSDAGPGGGGGTGGSGSADGGTADAGMKDAGPGSDASTPPDAGPAKPCSVDGDCDDGDGCNGMESCVQGLCHQGTAVVCGASGDPCKENLCVNHQGTAACELMDANEDQTCADDDVSDQPQASCARDHVCKSGRCQPQTVDTCTPGMCQLAAGCAAGTGCVYAAAAATTSCDDGLRCTDSDHCDGTTGACVGTQKNCADSIGCTVDSCDESTGNCQNIPTDSLCTKPCQVGTCSATADCSYTALADGTACDDGSSATTPDFCYLGSCAGGNMTTPSASCAVGGCACTTFSNAKDLEYYASKYIALWSITQSSGTGCVNGEVSAVYEVNPTSLRAYSSDLQPGGGPGFVAGPANDLQFGFAIANSYVGLIDTSAGAVNWSTNYLNNALKSTGGTPALVHYQGAAYHGEGAILGGTSVYWLWGDDSSTNTTGRLVRCSWSNCVIAPCSDPVPSCVYDTAFAAATFVGVAPYTKSSGSGLSSRAYAGVNTAVNFDSGPPTRRLYDDDTNKDYVPSHVARADNDGAWHSLLGRNNQSLAYGSGAANLVYCEDPEYDGTVNCTAVTGAPNQANRTYTDAEFTPNGGMVLISNSCTGLCTGVTYYLTLLPPGADPTQGANWTEYPIGSWSGIAGATNTVPYQVAAGGTSIVVVGLHGSVPYVQTFGTF